MMKNSILKAGVLLLIFTAISVFFVTLTQDTTKEKIKYNEDQLLIKRLGELVLSYDNNILEDKFSKEIK
ncbi:MAG: electron transporter RnfG, partial [Candidatus Ruthia sp.]|nr:electron transporter RnfG [Candidatus Ruthturnera sp.]